MKIARLLMVLLALTVIDISYSDPLTSTSGDPQSVRCVTTSSSMIGKLSLPDRLPSATLSGNEINMSAAHGKAKGGSSLQTLVASGGWWYYCYSDPNTVYDCDLGSWECRQECERTCNGPCDWDEQ